MNLRRTILTLMLLALLTAPGWSATPSPAAAQADEPTPDRDARIAELKQTVKQDELNSKLAIACYYGDLESVERLLDEGADVNATDYPKRLVIIGDTPLMAAVFGDQTEIVRLLIERGADPEIYSDYSTPLDIAATWGKTGAARILLAHGANPNQTHSGYTQGMTAADSLAMMIAFQGAYPFTVFKDAVGNGHREVVELMIEHGGYYLAPDSFIDAVIRGDAERLREELKQGDKRLEGMIGMMGWKPIQLAAMLGRAETIRVLAKKGAKLEYEDENEGDPLLLAAQHGNLEAVRTLIELGVEINPPGEKRAGLLKTASSKVPYTISFLRYRPRRVNNERLELVDYLLHDVPTTTPLSELPLHEAAQMNSPEVINLLIDAGAEVVTGDESVESPLRSALSSPEAARVLLEHGADPDAVSIRGMPLLNWAAKSPYPDVTDLLLECGADYRAVDENGATALHMAALEGSAVNVELLLEAGADVHARDKDGLAPLDYAIWGVEHYWDPLVDAEKSLRLLLDAGADIFREDHEGSLAIHNGAIYARPELISILIEAGADPGAADDLGQTPLHYACEHGHAGTARLLLDLGVDPLPKNNDRKTPWELIPSEVPEKPAEELEILLLQRMAEELSR